MNQIRQMFARYEVPDADIRDIRSLDTRFGQNVVAIYENAFPEEERDPVDEIAASLHGSDDTEVVHLRALVEQNEVMGFTYFSTYPDYYLGFLKFIAVRADLRGRGYGPVLLQDAIRQVRADGICTMGWPYLGLVFEVERPEAAENAHERQLRERRIHFYQRNGATMIKGIDFIAPPITPQQPSIPFHLMVLKAVPKYGMRWWLRQSAVKAILVKGYGEEMDSWFVTHALDVRRRARKSKFIFFGEM